MSTQQQQQQAITIQGLTVEQSRRLAIFRETEKLTRFGFSTEQAKRVLFVAWLVDHERLTGDTARAGR